MPAAETRATVTAGCELELLHEWSPASGVTRSASRRLPRIWYPLLKPLEIGVRVVTVIAQGNYQTFLLQGHVFFSERRVQGNVGKHLP